MRQCKSRASIQGIQMTQKSQHKTSGKNTSRNRINSKNKENYQNSKLLKTEQDYKVVENLKLKDIVKQPKKCNSQSPLKTECLTNNSRFSNCCVNNLNNIQEENQRQKQMQHGRLKEQVSDYRQQLQYIIQTDPRTTRCCSQDKQQDKLQEQKDLKNKYEKEILQLKKQLQIKSPDVRSINLSQIGIQEESEHITTKTSLINNDQGSLKLHHILIIVLDICIENQGVLKSIQEQEIFKLKNYILQQQNMIDKLQEKLRQYEFNSQLILKNGV
ncbi:hypothetical protein pb186bvf_013412 [Paramecium bursaria]